MGQFLLFFVVMGHPEDEVKTTAGHELPSLARWNLGRRPASAILGSFPKGLLRFW